MFPILRPGDVLLYRPRGIFGWLIAVKTWHQISHVEVYIGNCQSLASRDGIGVGRYPVRLTDLAVICRPKQPIDLAAGLEWFGTVNGQPYSWLDLLAFIGLAFNGHGMICSTFATECLRASGLDPFNGEDAGKIAPFQFPISPVFDVIEEP